jgi:hypothetical protein
MATKLPPNRKTEPKRDDPEESKRFIEMAREVEADEREDALDRALGNLDLRKELAARTISPPAAHEPRRGGRSPK